MEGSAINTIILLTWLAILILSLMFKIPGTGLFYIYKNYLNRNLAIRIINPGYRTYLQANLDFYNRLDTKGKNNFEKRVQRFIEKKQFIPRSKGMKITDEMKALIAGTAVMMTYGFPAVYLQHFWRILIYKDNYYSTITHRYHKGEVNPNGIIVLSWASFVEGFIDRKDGRNLGIHEMAHALRLENRIFNEDYGFISGELLKEFESEAQREISYSLNNGGSSYLRSYSVTNRHEFFAVATESFFENPSGLRNHNINLYRLLVQIFRFDPITLEEASLKRG